MDKSLSTEISKRQNVDFLNLASYYLPDPDPILQGHRSVAVLKILLSDAHLSSCVTSRKSGVLCKEWQLVGENSQQLKFIQDVFKAIDIDALISDILNAPLFGYQPIEVVWGLDGNLIIPVKVEAKPSEWFVFDSENKLKFLSLENSIQGVAVPDRKFLLPRNNPSYDNPYGHKLLSSCFWPVAFKKGGCDFWVTFVEKYGMPMAVGKLPKNLLENEGPILRDALENMVQDGVAVIDTEGDISILEASGKADSSSVYGDLINFSNQEISKAILGQTLTTEVGSSGSYAAGKVHFEVRQDIIEADKRLVQKTINQFISWICELNFSDLNNIPCFKLLEEEDTKKEWAERDQILNNMGVKFTKEHYVRTYGIDANNFEIVDVKTKGPAFASSEDADVKKKDIFDELSELYSDEELQQQAEELLNPVLKIINESNDFNEALNKLANVYPEMSSNKLIDKLNQVCFIANVVGNIDGSSDTA